VYYNSIMQMTQQEYEYLLEEIRRIIDNSYSELESSIINFIRNLDQKNVSRG
jgi:hypothetical protein